MVRDQEASHYTLAGTEYFVSAGERLLPLTANANFEPGDILVLAAAPLMHTPLETCVTNPPAPNGALRQNALSTVSMSVSLTLPIYPYHMFTLWTLLDQLPTLLMKCFHVYHQNFGIVSRKCGTSFPPIRVALTSTIIGTVGNPPSSKGWAMSYWSSRINFLDP